MVLTGQRIRKTDVFFTDDRPGFRIPAPGIIKKVSFLLPSLIRMAIDRQQIHRPQPESQAQRKGKEHHQRQHFSLTAPIPRQDRKDQERNTDAGSQPECKPEFPFRPLSHSESDSRGQDQDDQDIPEP